MKKFKSSLDRWIKENGLKMVWVARQWGMSYNALIKLSNPKKYSYYHASRELAEEIQRRTNGAVKVEDLIR